MRENRDKALSFGSHLKERRLSHPERLSIREVARRAGIDVSYLSRMEKDEVAPPREEVILRLSEVLGVEDPDELLNFADKIHPDLREIIKSQHENVPDFLRITKDLSQEDWKRLTKYVKKNLLSSKETKK